MFPWLFLFLSLRRPFDGQLRSPAQIGPSEFTVGFAAVSQVWGIFKAWRWHRKFCHADVNRSGFTCGMGGSKLSRWAILQAISWSNWTRKVPWAGGVCASLQRYFCYGLLQFGRHRHTSKIQHAGSTHDNPGWTISFGWHPERATESCRLRTQSRFHLRARQIPMLHCG